jgi:hypothetical protein
MRAQRLLERLPSLVFVPIPFVVESVLARPISLDFAFPEGAAP